ncbi:MAG: 2-hydroxy-3-oxopropionate reductase [Rubrobacteraceae bacterium]|uniref:2-hydroxy-3-oxopropionate reductase n=1 Tax=Rubrobacter naiadicus TaxID=1392641 RepID=UPI00235DE6D0|nr:2-hydroxy-3-oxopropionate reductase [Rubrobacter naiadicus]MCL6439661.1 2-hydroxy-3-oxopropionate reductase [Rubrobacteraceae bacterium]
MRVGFVGLGIMGWPMAENLVQAGYDLTVHNRTKKKAEEFAKNTGAQLAESPREVANNSDVVITMLPGPPEVEEVFLGEDGLIEGAGTGALLVDMSTSSPLLARKIAEVAREQGASALDAPVSGGDVGAKEGTLSIMVGGEQEDFERARPLFEVMGRTITHVGPSGAGQVVKAANQIVVALSIEAVSEALVLGERGGVSAEKILDVLSGGLAGNRVMEVKREKFLSHVFEPGGKARYHHKDLGIALDTARELGVVLPAAALADQLFAALEAQGRGDLDHSALLVLVEEMSGISRRGG